MNKNIYLVGFMGAGKSAVGKELSARTNKNFIEMDEIIEQKEGMAISDIFAKKGENYFRLREKALLADIAKDENLIVSCGGGVVIDQDNIILLKKTGFMIWLEADIETLYRRTKSCVNRPLLDVANPEEKIRQLLKQRQAFYREAHFWLDTSHLSVDQVADEIARKLKDD
ncbi:MAG: shikimate kinase [Candidatus Omnitrophota bacterium]